MGTKSQRKGRGGELELAKILQAAGLPAEAAPPLNYGSQPDLTGLPGIHVEVKRHEQLRIPEWMAQAEQDADKFRDGLPAVFHRRNGEQWRVTMNLKDWITLYKQTL